jgi:hypothetical protein
MLTETNPFLRNMTVTSLWKCNELIVTHRNYYVTIATLPQA